MEAAYFDPFSFDPTYGHCPAALRIVRMEDPAPDGFERFWKALHAASEHVPLRLSIEELSTPRPEYQLLLVKYSAFSDYRTGVWTIVIPRECGMGEMSGTGMEDAKNPTGPTRIPGGPFCVLSPRAFTFPPIRACLSMTAGNM